MKVDSHVHITPPDIIANWPKYTKNEPYFSLLSNAKHNVYASAKDVINVMEADKFDRAVVFGFAFRDMGLCRYVNDYVIESIRKYPDKLIGFAVVPPENKDTAREIERCYNAGLRGVGELFPAGQKIDLINADKTSSITNTCKELNIPLMLHANETVGHEYAGKTDIPMVNLENFVSNNPELKIILAHFGGGILFFETMKEIKEKFKNVYYDTAIAPFLYDYKIYDCIKALDLCKKILFGSDFPVLPPSRYMEAFDSCNLSDEEKRLIFGANAEKLLGLNPS